MEVGGPSQFSWKWATILVGTNGHYIHIHIYIYVIVSSLLYTDM